MLEKNKKNRKQKICYRCLRPVTSNSRKCSGCGNVFKSTGRYLFDKVKGVFDIQKVFPAPVTGVDRNGGLFFTPDDVEQLFIKKNFKVLIFLVLTDFSYLDETSLIELGETLSSLEKITHHSNTEHLNLTFLSSESNRLT